MVGATATGSLKDAGKTVRLGRGGALVGGSGLAGGGLIGKDRGREEKEQTKEECNFFQTHNISFSIPMLG